jgi:malonyl-CoA/methylmalonyl-CoA synthetase
MTPSSLLARWTARAGDPRAAVIGAGGASSWRDVVAGADALATELLRGRPSLAGARVALLVSPGAAFVTSFFGVLRAGGAVVPLSPLHPPPEVQRMCDDAAVEAVIASPPFAGRAAALGLPLVAADASRPAGPPPPARPSDGDPALQVYTSGTTSRPKGAVLTHANLAVQQELLGETWGLREDDVLLHVLPLHHIHGIGIAMLAAIGSGATVHFLDFTSRSFDAAATWEAMAQATVFMAVPSIHTRLMAALDAADDATRARWIRHAAGLRLVTSGSAALPVTLGERWRGVTGAYPLERFGMTELGVALSNPLDPERRRPGTVGLPLRDVRVRIVGDDGRESDAGELWIAGPSVFAGYHGRPDTTNDSFVVEGATRWFKTGDTVARDGNGYVRILGRTSVDILKSGGYKLSALEIEEAIREHPAVAEVAVVGVPDVQWGDRVVACVIARPGSEAACEGGPLRAFLKERIAAYKVPRQVVVVRELPRNAMGKVIKPELVARVASIGASGEST